LLPPFCTEGAEGEIRCSLYKLYRLKKVSDPGFCSILHIVRRERAPKICIFLLRTSVKFRTLVTGLSCRAQSAMEVSTYARIMYNISRSKTGGVVLKCKVCSHSEGVNEFDDRLGNRRMQAAQAMLNHTRSGHGKEPVGRPMSKALDSWV
jgi:hypothetical protein